MTSGSNCTQKFETRSLKGGGGDGADLTSCGDDESARLQATGRAHEPCRSDKDTPHGGESTVPTVLSSGALT